MPIAAWSDIDAIDEAPQSAPTSQIASFADIDSIEPAAVAPPRRATFADIASIEPPAAAPAFSPLEQEVIAASPATLSRTAPSAEQTFKLAPSVPIGSDIALPKDAPPRPAPPLRPGRMAGLADTAPRSTTTTPQDIIGGVLQAPVGALQALPAAAGEQLAGTTLPGHEREPPTLLGRTWQHLTMAGSGHGGEVLPQGAITQALVGNPAEASTAPAPAAADLLAHGPSAAAVNPKVQELARRGLGTAAKMLMDPALVAIGAAPATMAEALSVVFAQQGTEAAIATATNPDATDIDVAESVINALLMTLPVGAQALRQIRTRLGAVAETARAVPEAARAETPPPVPPEAPPEATAAPPDAARPGAPVPEAAVPPEPVGEAPPVNVAHVDDIVAVEPPAPGAPPQTAHVDDVVHVEPPAAAAPNVGHVDDIVSVEPPQTSAAEPPAVVEPPAAKEPRGTRAPAVEWQDLTTQHQREVRRILLELQELGFSGKTFNETTRRGGDLDVKGRVAGAPVYWDIVGGDAKAGPTFRYDRGAVIDKLKAFAENGKRSVVSDLAVDVAERRLAGDRSLAEPLLPPEAGDEPGAVRVTRRSTFEDKEKTAVQRRAVAAVENDAADLAATYRERFGNVVSADNAKELFPDYATKEQRTANDLAVHRPASRLAQHLYDDALKQPVAEGHDPYVMLTAGGTGAGKTTSLDSQLPGMREHAHVVYDSTLTDLDAARTNIEAAKAAGHQVMVVFVDREVNEAFRATLDRAVDHGRPVTVNTHVATHLKAQEVFDALRKEYGADPDVTLTVVRNSTKGRELISPDAWEPRRYNEGDVRAHLTRILDEERSRLGDPLANAVQGAAEKTAPAAAHEANAGGNRRVQPDAASGRSAEDARGTREVVDTLDTGEAQPRLPGAADARQVGKADTSFRAPAQASGADFKLETPLTAEQKAADAKNASGPSMFDEDGALSMPEREADGSWDRPFSSYADAAAAAKPGQRVRSVTVSGGPKRFIVEDVPAGRRPLFGDDGALTMPNRGKRADSSGALVPSPASRAIGLLKPGEKQLRPSEIVARIAKDLDQLPINVGKFKQHALGIYKVKPQTIRLKVANDFEVLAHELGHHIHESLIGGELPAKNYRGELEALGLPTSRSSYSLKQKLQEGQAEFTRLYLSDPAAAKKAAPVYYQAFETGLQQHPELAGVLQRAQRQYVGHLAQDPVTRGLSHLDFDGVDPSPKTDVVTRLQTAWVDDLYPLRRMTEDLAANQPIDYTRNGYVLARLARGASAKAAGFLEHGVRAADGTFIAPALEPALKPVKGQIREFAGYLTALRAVELRGRGMETGMSLEEARAIVAKFKSPTFDAARDAVYAYQDGLLVYATHAGTLSVDQLKAIKALNKAYVPFQRVLTDVGASAGNGGKGGVANRTIPVKRIKGSGRDVINPLESIIKNTHTLVGMVEQNRAMAALVDQAENTVGGGRYLEAIPEKQVATMFNLQKVAKDIKGELDAAGVDYPDNLDFDKLVTVFTPTQFRMGEKGVVSVLRDGKRRWFQVNDQALYDAIATVGPKSSDLLVNMLMKPARLLRAGATTSIGFIARNPIRDNVEAYVNSRYGFKPGYDFVRGVFELAKKGEDYQAFLNSGAGNSAMVGLDRNRLRQELVKMGAAKRRVFADSVVLNPVNLLQAVSEAMEHATRIGEFKRGVETEGRTAEGFARAALAARDVTIDFARGGTISKEVNRFTAFFNAGVQGNVRLAEVFRSDPLGATRRAVLAITLPSLALWAINQDDPTYRELPDWERNTYWHIPTSLGAGHSWARVPKPFSLGQVFANAPEAALDYLRKKDPEALTRVLPDKQTAWKQLIALLPTAVMPAVELAANYDTFRDRAIVNAADVNLDTALQYNRWTSDLAKYVGPKIGIPPAKLDHLIYGYGAGVGAGAVQTVDKVAGLAGLVKNQKPAGGLGRAPLVGTFYRETPGADARSLEQFYRLRDRVEGAVGSVRRYEKIDDQAAAATRKTEAQTAFGPDAGQTLERVRATDKALTELRGDVNQVFANPRLDPDEKKELLDRLYERMVNAARAGMEKPALPSRFPKPPAPALLEKLQRVKPSAPAGRPAAVNSGASDASAKPAAPTPRSTVAPTSR